MEKDIYKSTLPISDYAAKKAKRMRLHHIKRLKKKRKNYWYANMKEWFGELSKKHLNMITKTTKPCSCYMCGNPRKYFNEKTLQEKKQDEKEKLSRAD